MTSKKNILLLTPSKIGLTETFIRAHIDQLNGNVFYLYGWDLDFKTRSGYNAQGAYKRTSLGYFDQIKNFTTTLIYIFVYKRNKKHYKLKKHSLSAI